MTNEQKAKAYDEALKRAKKATQAGGDVAMDIIQYIFPQLKESEDERIRKEIIHYILYKASEVPEKQEHEWVAYLEKKKERGHLTKEEEYTLHRIIEYLEDETCPSEWISLLHDIYCLPYEKQKESLGNFIDDFPYSAQKEQNLNPSKSVGLKEQKPVEYLSKDKVYAIMTKLTNLSYSNLIPLNSDEYKKIHEITSDVRSLLDYPIEQKPAEWSKEDEKIRQSIIKDIEFKRNYTYATTDKVIGKYNEQINWLKALHLSLKKRNEDIEKLCSNEWSEEDEKNLEHVIDCIHEFYPDPIMKYKLKDWVKSLRPQYHGDVTMTEAYKMGFEAGKASSWKPSEEQLTTLLRAEGIVRVHDTKELAADLARLYEQLKRLL